jgi:predicted nuclease with TOPRIM domain
MSERITKQQFEELMAGIDAKNKRIKELEVERNEAIDRGDDLCIERDLLADRIVELEKERTERADTNASLLAKNIRLQSRLDKVEKQNERQLIRLIKAGLADNAYDGEEMMSDRMTDERLAEIEAVAEIHDGYPDAFSGELLQALKAERERIAELEEENTRLREERLAFAIESEQLQSRLDDVKYEIDHTDVLGMATDVKERLLAALKQEKKIAELQSQLDAVKPYLRHSDACVTENAVQAEEYMESRCTCGLIAALQQEKK